MSRSSDKACHRKKLRYRREDDICGVLQSCTWGSPSIAAATFCIAIDCANGMSRRWQFSSDKLLLSPSVPTADYFLSMSARSEGAKCAIASATRNIRDRNSNARRAEQSLRYKAVRFEAGQPQLRYGLQVWCGVWNNIPIRYIARGSIALQYYVISPAVGR